MLKLTFSGHESFTCRQLWPKKGYDFLSKGRRFGDDFTTFLLDLNLLGEVELGKSIFGWNCLLT